MVSICGLIMVKNEESSIITTIDSIKHLNEIIIFDTGSTDDTIKVVEKLRLNSELKLIITNAIFVDFSTSRNEMLEFANNNSSSDYFLLLDANDELIGDLSSVLSKESKLCDCYLIKQIWQTNNLNEYFNLRLIKSKLNFKYAGEIHEYIIVPPEYTQGKLDVITIYQDRRRGCESSKSRWTNDLKILLNAYKRDPTDTRTVFYLAQTYDCLEIKGKALETYKIRYEMNGFYEEKYYSAVKCGDLYNSWDDKLKWYLCAYSLIKRAEPLIKIAEYYNSIKNFNLAHLFVRAACQETWPHDCLLFIDTDVYNYKRWHLLGIISYYVKDYISGKRGCEMAIKAKNLDIDLKNLKFYCE